MTGWAGHARHFASSKDPLDHAALLFLYGDDNQMVRSAQSHISSMLTVREQEDLRWYLEDYLSFPEEPAPLKAQRIETRMTELGEQLFNEIFENSNARRIWDSLKKIVRKTRIEGASPATSMVPWELARAPNATPLALECRAFVHTGRKQMAAGDPTVIESDRLRILLLICRPETGDVPYRSVASRVIAAVGDELGRRLQIDVLRPPTLESLNDALKSAVRNGRPYQIVHFDGHGEYKDLTAEIFHDQPTNLRGYLLFEGARRGREYVDGEALGRILVASNVPFLILNACRSGAVAIPGAEPTLFESVAGELVGAGVSSVVAMRYNVYVVSAAHFV